MSRSTETIVRRNPKLAAQLDAAAKGKPATPKPKGKQQGRDPSEAEKDAPAVLEMLKKREGWVHVDRALLRLAGAKGTEGGAEKCDYLPDFFAWKGKNYADECVIIEVKGGYVREDARVKFKLFQLLPMFNESDFLWLERKKKGGPWIAKWWKNGHLYKKEKIVL